MTLFPLRSESFPPSFATFCLWGRSARNGLLNRDAIGEHAGSHDAFLSEFTEDELHMSHGDPEHGTQYFPIGGPIPTQELARQFMLYYADSATGVLASSSWAPSETMYGTYSPYVHV